MSVDSPFDVSRAPALTFDLDAQQEEWLEADGLGGFASGTVSGIRTRRYHALLLSATLPPTGRLVLINGVEAWLETPAAHDPSHPSIPPHVTALTTQRYASGNGSVGAAMPDTIYPDGWRKITGFAATPWPSWELSVPAPSATRATHATGTTDSHDHSPDATGNDATTAVSLIFDVFASGDSGDTVLRWRVDGLPPPWLVRSRLCVRPLLSIRDYHSLHRENAGFDFTPRGSAGRISWRPYADRPAVTVASNGDYQHAPEWFRNFVYSEEQARGMDAIEDLAAPGIFSFDLAHEPALMILRAGDTRDVRVRERVARIAHHERTARVAASAQPSASDTPDTPTARATASAASYFVERGLGATIVAGYPWFTDWGRDTFISLRGLALSTGRLAQAGAILGEWALTVSEGMLPNRFPDGGEAPEYNSVDASLWFIVAMHAYLQTDHASPALRQKLRHATDQILDGFMTGTRFGIAAQPDGLLHAGMPGSQLTWMDARANGVAVTPRVGKPVEIQALWINALRIGSAWRPEWTAAADRAQTAFNARFIDPVGGALFDLVDGTSAVDATVDADGIDRSIRPNQIFAVGGLPFRVVDDVTARAVVAQVERELLTPLGLRTLSPSDPRYQGRYEGPPDVRDNAYHQGTVWPWLMGPFVEAWLRVHHGLTQGTPTTSATTATWAVGSASAVASEARRRFIAPLDAHLLHAGVGHISEIADGDAPYTPRGAPFQAWSLAERLRLETLLSSIQ